MEKSEIKKGLRLGILNVIPEFLGKSIRMKDGLRDPFTASAIWQRTVLTGSTEQEVQKLIREIEDITERFLMSEGRPLTYPQLTL
jgi:hypothetical protein